MKIPKIRKRFIVAGLAVAALGAWWLLKNDDAEAALQTAVVARENLSETVTAQGEVEPFKYVDVGAQVSGQLDKIHAEIGDVVSASQLIAEIDPRVYESRLQQAEAGLRSLKAQLIEQQANAELAAVQHERNAQMVSVTAISKQEFDTTASALKVARARVESLKAQIAQSESSLSEDKTNLGFTKIYAPISGTVVSTSVKEGQTINASQQAPTILTIADLAVMTVRGQVAEADVGRLTVGMPLTFTTLDMAHTWKTTVRQILPSPQVVNDVVLYNVLADVDNPDGRLMNGMSTQMTFVLREAKNVLTVPASALTAKKTGKDGVTAAVVSVVQGSKPVSTSIVLGLETRSAVEVKSGLTEGDVVVLNGAAPAAAGGAAASRGGRAMGPRL